MKQNLLKILLVEDNPGDVRLIQEILSEAQDVKFRLKNAERLNSGIELLRGNGEKFDIVILDLGLPDSQGIDTLVKLQQQAFRIPIVVLTGFNDGATSLKAVEMGAQDYLLKGQITLDSLSRAIFNAIWRFQALENLKHKVILENLITKISTKFINYKSEEIDSGINEALSDIGKFMEIDWTYFFRVNNTGGKSSISNIYEWVPEGGKSVVELLKKYGMSELRWFSEQMRLMETMTVTDVAKTAGSCGI